MADNQLNILINLNPIPPSWSHVVQRVGKWRRVGVECWPRISAIARLIAVPISVGLKEPHRTLALRAAESVGTRNFCRGIYVALKIFLV